ncbi:MAG: winged helix-turn-helix transcriptional regulator [Calditrichaeota bacterium]|nr:winged helix-turn-helix transcriptional regulator [Calditrichota bacterium]
MIDILDSPGLCEVQEVNPEVVDRIRQAIGATDLTLRTAAIFKVVADPTRLRIVQALQEEELCVCDLAAIVGQSQSSTSHHLRLLRQRNLVKVRRRGRMVFYSLADAHVSALLAVARDHAREELPTPTSINAEVTLAG